MWGEQREKIKGLKFIDFGGVRCFWDESGRRYKGEWDDEAWVIVMYDPAYKHAPFSLILAYGPDEMPVARSSGATWSDVQETFISATKAVAEDLNQRLILLELVEVRCEKGEGE